MKVADRVDEQQFALRVFLEKLASGELKVDSAWSVATTLQINVPSNLMCHVIDDAVKAGLVRSRRTRQMGENYPCGPLRYTITESGRTKLVALQS